METNVHFPTDLNLLWDSLRVTLGLLGKELVGKPEIIGWRKLRSMLSKTKSIYRSCSQAVFKGKNEYQKEKMVKLYLKHSRQLMNRVNDFLIQNPNEKIQKYNTYVLKFTDQIERRLIKGEVIPSEEKVYSIFEEHTEWISKGKRSPELGNAVLVTTSQYKLIMDYKIMYKEKDASQVAPLLARIKTTYPNAIIYSHSFDKGFYSKENYDKGVAAQIENVIMPKKGKPNKTEYTREHTATFIRLRKKHSGIESNINMLERHGLNLCPDRGIPNLEKYVSLSVLAYNLHHIGNEIIQQQKKKEQLALKRSRYRQAA